jgi:acyl carrier protein
MTEITSDIRGHLREYVAENFLYLRPGFVLGDDDDLLEAGVLDSLGFIELVEEVQTRFSISVQDVDITEENFGSIASIARYVEERRTEA